MKPQKIFFTLCLTLFSLIVLAQNDYDKIIMKDGTVHIGKYISKDSTHIRFREGEYAVDFQTVYIPILDIDKMTLRLGEGRKRTTLINEFRGNHIEVKDSTVSNQKPILSSIIPTTSKNTGYHLTRGGRFGIAGVSFLIGGSIMGIVGAMKGIPALAYTGVGLSGLGGVFLIVPFGQMIRAGNKYPKPIH